MTRQPFPRPTRGCNTDAFARSAPHMSLPWLSRRFPLVAALLVVASLPSAAQDAGRLPRLLSVGVGGGGTVPVGDFAKDVKTGWNGMAFFQYEPLSGTPWAVRAEAQFSKAKYTDDLLLDAGATEGDDLSNKVLYVGLSALYHLAPAASKARPVPDRRARAVPADREPQGPERRERRAIRSQGSASTAAREFASAATSASSWRRGFISSALRRAGERSRRRSSFRSRWG